MKHKINCFSMLISEIKVLGILLPPFLIWRLNCISGQNKEHDSCDGKLSSVIDWIRPFLLRFQDFEQTYAPKFQRVPVCGC